MHHPTFILQEAETPKLYRGFASDDFGPVLQDEDEQEHRAEYLVCKALAEPHQPLTSGSIIKHLRVDLVCIHNLLIHEPGKW